MTPLAPRVSASPVFLKDPRRMLRESRRRRESRFATRTSFNLLGWAVGVYEPCTLITSFFAIFSSIRNCATSFLWSPWS